MSSLPKNWVRASLNELVTFNPKHAPGLADDLPVSFVPMAAVDEIEGRIATPQVRDYGEVKKGYTHFQSGDVIFAKITPCMENGKSAVARDLVNGIACGTTEFHVLRPSPCIEADFLWRFLRQSSFREDAEQSMTGAVGQRRVPADYLKQAHLALPPVAEQHRIVAKIDSLSDKSKRARESLDHVPRLVEKYKQAVLKVAFRNGFGLGSVSDSAFEPRPLSEATVSTFYGPRIAKEDYVLSGIPTLRTTDIADWGRLSLQDPPQVRVGEDEKRKWAFQDGDLMVTRTGATIGKCAVYEAEYGPALPSAYLIRVRLDQQIADPHFVLLFLLSPSGQRQLLDGRTAVAQPNINANAILSVRLPLPATELQKKIVHRIKHLFSWIDRLAGEATSARKLIDHLDQAVLAKAFRGELVPQDPNDEPASVLLERIKAERATGAAKPKRKGK